MSSSHLSPRRRHWWQWWRRAEAPIPTLPQLPAPTLGGVGLDLRGGTVTALVGQPPAAASRVLHTVAGLSVSTDPAAPAEGEQPRARTSLVFRTPGLRPELDTRANMLLDAATSGRRIGEDRLASLIADAGLEAVDDLGAQALTPSEAVFVALVRALAPSPGQVLLDGSLDDLDDTEAARAMALLHRAPEGAIVLVATQRPDIAVLADRVAVIRDGRVAADIPHPTPDALAAALTHPGAEAPGPVPPANPGAYAAPATDEGAPALVDEEPAGREETPADRGSAQRPRTPPVTPYPASSPAWDEDPRTQEIALLAVARVRAVKAAAARTAAVPDTLREELGAEDLHDALERLTPGSDLPDPSADVVDRARQILGGLPGRVMPED